MSLIESILLGAIQGLTEFLPVSSSGHLVIFQELLGINQPGILFEIVVHVGTLVAVIIYFWKDIFNLVNSLFKWGEKSNSKTSFYHNLLLYIFISTLVTGIIGFSFKEQIEPIFENLSLVGLMLLLTGTILFISDKIKNANKEKVGLFNSIVVGIAQSFAILPGISRAGATITTGVFTGLKRELATKFSFLLSIPAIFGASLLKIKELTGLAKSTELLFPFLLAGITAAVVGYFSITLLVKMIKRAKLIYFAAYCWLIGIFLLVYIQFII